MKTVRWNDLKKKLNVSKSGLELAEAKLALSELIYDLRQSRKMSQKELASAVGVSQPYIAKIEDGEENLTIETIIKLLSALKTSLHLKTGSHHKGESIFHIAA
jgi:transcriptional regulator with XRE-family HTH domain